MRFTEEFTEILRTYGIKGGAWKNAVLLHRQSDKQAKKSYETKNYLRWNAGRSGCDV